METIIIIITAAFILLESREVFQGMLSQPLITSLLLYFMGFDPVFVFSTAVLTQLAYLNRIPSGAVHFPAYQFSYFAVTGAICLHTDVNTSDSNSYYYSALALLLIFLFSMLVARLLYLKRRVLGTLLDRETMGTKRINLSKIAVFGIMLTISSGIIISSVIILLINGLIDLLPTFTATPQDMTRNFLLALSCGFLPWRLLHKNNLLFGIAGSAGTLLFLWFI